MGEWPRITEKTAMTASTRKKPSSSTHPKRHKKEKRSTERQAAKVYLDRRKKEMKKKECRPADRDEGRSSLPCKQSLSFLLAELIFI
mmetsp:Transcript_49202/g.96984  ORF Transcript_49202/g.96984 Transcript_49202/m.96984 type:complete len:87 (+) Transcript_49202:1-261(+)